MLESSMLLAFVPVALVLIVAPGPGSIYVLTQSIMSGPSPDSGLGSASRAAASFSGSARNSLWRSTPQSELTVRSY